MPRCKFDSLADRAVALGTVYCLFENSLFSNSYHTYRQYYIHHNGPQYWAMYVISFLIEAKPANETTYVTTGNGTVVGIPSHNQHMQWLISEFQKRRDFVEEDCKNWCDYKERGGQGGRIKAKYKHDRGEGVSQQLSIRLCTFKTHLGLQEAPLT